MIIKLAICLLLSAVFIGCTKTEDHSAMECANGHNMKDPSEKMMTNEDKMASMNTMMVEHLGQSDAEYDHRFINMMITHHQGALMMARDAQQKARHPELKRLADEIIAAQQKEIALLEEWRSEWYKH
ncbi:MAG: DUF305 domain-containing protein [Candidatus Kapabacteria bacterium]|nr:DUF305 domain-containing protein [Candidatus Kapabacteria bacterium]